MRLMRSASMVFLRRQTMNYTVADSPSPLAEAELDDPVGFPGEAPVVREILRPARGVGTQLRPVKDDLDRSAAVLVVAVEPTGGARSRMCAPSCPTSLWSERRSRPRWRRRSAERGGRAGGGGARRRGRLPSARRLADPAHRPHGRRGAGALHGGASGARVAARPRRRARSRSRRIAPPANALAMAGCASRFRSNRSSTRRASWCGWALRPK